MCLPILTAIRQQHELKESLLHTAQELAHRASIYGVARVSYSYLAKKCHCCRQTIINHIRQLIALKLIRKSTVWIKGNYCEVNTYTFVIVWDKSLPKRGSQNSVPNLPPPEEREKSEGVGEKIRQLEKGLRFCTKGSEVYTGAVAELERLRALLPGMLREG